MSRRAPLALTAALVVAAGAACAPDPAVTTLDAAPIAAPPTTVPTTAPPSVDPPGTVPLPTLPAQPPPATDPPAPTGPTLPPILEPELFTEVPLGDVVNVGAERQAREYDALLGVALVDIDGWLAEQLPIAFGTAWHPLEGGIWAGYPARSDALPGCGEQATAYDDLVLYAAFYCEFGDFMAFDDGDSDRSIIGPLADNLGASVLGVVLAHEYGHAVQQRVGALAEGYPTVLTEQQADCVAGAWLGRAYRGESPNLRLGDRDLRAGLVAMVEVRDPAGIDQFEIGGHGTAFDRVGAFQLGFASGLEQCAGLLDDPLPLMPNVFQQGTLDEFLGGNAPYDCAELPADLQADCTPAPEFLADDLNDYWQDRDPAFPTLTPQAVDDFDSFGCADEVTIDDTVSYCPGENTIVYDEPVVLDLYREFGDFTLGYFYGVAWAEVAQLRAGRTLTDEARALERDCWTGAWVRDITPDETGNTRRSADLDGDGEPDSTVLTSPGDLDEAVRMAILLGDLGSNVDVNGSPFEKIASFRAGVLGGMDACPT